MKDVNRIDGGGSYSICPDTGAVTANHIEADAPVASEAGQPMADTPIAGAESAPAAAPITGKRSKSNTQQES